MNFNSSDFGSDVSPPSAEPQEPRPQRSRAVVGTLLAAVIAFILIAIVLAIISTLGERRLSLLPGRSIAPVAVHHYSSRETPGLSAPSPLPTIRSTVPSLNPADGPEHAHGLAAGPPAGMAPAARVSPQAPPEAALVPAPAATFPPPTTEWQVRKVFASLPFTRIHDAFLWKPYTEPNPKALQRPEPDENLVQLRQASRLTPEAVRTIVEQRRPMATLAQARAQASMHRANPATTQPSS